MSAVSSPSSRFSTFCNRCRRFVAATSSFPARRCLRHPQPDKGLCSFTKCSFDAKLVDTFAQGSSHISLPEIGGYRYPKYLITKKVKNVFKINIYRSNQTLCVVFLLTSAIYFDIGKKYDKNLNIFPHQFILLLGTVDFWVYFQYFLYKIVVS